MKKPTSARNRKRKLSVKTRPKKKLPTNSLPSGRRPKAKMSKRPKVINGAVSHQLKQCLHSHVGEIAFYRANEQPFGAFSNLYRRSIIFEGIKYPTAEHAYQAGKARTKAVREWLMSAPSPALLAMAAHGLYTWDVTPGWSSKKYDRMKRVLYAKFSQHADLRQLLLGTGNARLVEAGRVANSVNKTWGEVNGKGLNMLGRLLMEVRLSLRSELQQEERVNSRVSQRAARISSRRKI